MYGRFRLKALGFLVFLSAGIACSAPNHQPANFVPLAFKAPMPAATVSGPIVDYYYGLTATSIVQWVLESGPTGGMTQYAPDYTLPGSCGAPTASTVVYAQRLAFVGCESGEVLPLGVNAQHKIVSSTRSPVPVPSPDFLLAPPTGAKHMLYAAEYGNGGAPPYTQAIAAISYANGGFKVLQTYPLSPPCCLWSDTDELAFYTNAGVSTLFVATAFDPTGCTNGTIGTIQFWSQAADGTLSPQKTISDCATASHVIVAGSELYWAGHRAQGAYNLLTNTPIVLPSPPWEAVGENADAMSVVASQNVTPTPSPTPLGHAPVVVKLARYIVDAVGSQGDVIEVLDKNGNLITNLAFGPNSNDFWTRCIRYGNIIIEGRSYVMLCYAFDSVSQGYQLIGYTQDYVEVTLGTFTTQQFTDQTVTGP